MTTDEKFDKILAILERIEARQIEAKEEVAEIQIHEPLVQGSFGTTDTVQKPQYKPSEAG